MNKSNELIKQIEANIKDLASETDNFKKSEFFRQYLDYMSHFWQYSYFNQMLIYIRMKSATKVAGFRTWQGLKRTVKKGSKAIKILAPSKKKITETDPETGQEKEKSLTLFFPVNVFDISQTEGEPLPEIDIVIKGDNYNDFLDKLVALCSAKNIKVDFKNLGINGLYGYSKGGKIAITNTQSINTQVNTIIHEIAHELLHQSKDKNNDNSNGNDDNNNNKTKFTKQKREIQAEGTVYVVTKHFGLENKSFNYLALYDADYKKIMDNLKSIAEASKEIIEFLEKEMIVAVKEEVV